MLGKVFINYRNTNNTRIKEWETTQNRRNDKRCSIKNLKKRDI